MYQKLTTYFEKISKYDKIGHAYLICNCTFDYILTDLTTVISKFLFEEEVDLNNNEDVIVIQPENNVIKKEKIQKLHEDVSTTSQSHSKKVYIISECDKLNDFAANSLLKLLEEPEQNIYAFLITSNIENVMKTIYSRCQILKFYNEDLSKTLLSGFSDEELEECLEVLNIIEFEQLHAIAKIGFISKKLKEREYLRKLFNFFLLAYRDILNIKLFNGTKYLDNFSNILENIASKLTSEDIVKRLTVVSKYNAYLDYNLNTNLMVDRYIIELVGDVE